MKSIDLKYCAFKKEAVFLELADIDRKNSPEPAGLRRTCLNKDKACEVSKVDCELEKE